MVCREAPNRVLTTNAALDARALSPGPRRCHLGGASLALPGMTVGLNPRETDRAGTSLAIAKLVVAPAARFQLAPDHPGGVGH
jgi:hypothetical protein